MKGIKNISKPHSRYLVFVGIDCGTETGFATWFKKPKLLNIQTVKIHEAMECVKELYATHGPDLLVRVEDARIATFKRAQDYYKAQGAGSVKRDASIWQDFLTDLGVDFEMVRPSRYFTKLTKEVFARLTGYTEPTNSHGRDAGMLVHGL